MKKHLLSLSALAMMLFSFSACEKDDDNNGSNRTEIISENDWVLQSATVRFAGADIPVTDQIEACERDNRYDFDDDGTGDINEGPTKCDPSDPDQYNFNWEFRNNETQLYLSTSVFGSAETFDIISLDRNRMVLAADVDFGGTTQRVTGTFVR